MAKAKKTEYLDNGPEVIAEMNTLEVQTKRPCSPETFNRIKKALLKLCPGENNDFVYVGFYIKANERMRFIQTKKTAENGYRVELGISIAHLGWDEELILVRENCTEKETVKLFRQICFEGKNTDDIELVQTEFKDIGAFMTKESEHERYDVFNENDSLEDYTQKVIEYLNYHLPNSSMKSAKQDLENYSWYIEGFYKEKYEPAFCAADMHFYCG